MSWDIVIFNLNKKVDHVEEINGDTLFEIGNYEDFKEIMDKRYSDLTWDGNLGKLVRPDFSIEFNLGGKTETLSNQLFHLYGENAVYEIIELCKDNQWQFFDTGLGQMIDLDRPEKNGFENHRKYVEKIMKK